MPIFNEMIMVVFFFIFKFSPFRYFDVKRRQNDKTTNLQPAN